LHLFGFQPQTRRAQKLGAEALEDFFNRSHDDLKEVMRRWASPLSWVSMNLSSGSRVGLWRVCGLADSRVKRRRQAQESKEENASFNQFRASHAVPNGTPSKVTHGFGLDGL
jgi:hypothetical protein